MPDISVPDQSNRPPSDRTRNTTATSAVALLLPLLLFLLAPALRPSATPIDAWSRDAAPSVLLGRSLSDRELLNALRHASTAESFDLVLGAADAVAAVVPGFAEEERLVRYDRPDLLRGLLEELPHHTASMRHLLATRYLERAYFDPTGEPRLPVVPERTLSYLDDYFGGVGDPGRPHDAVHPGDVTLAAVYFRLTAVYGRMSSAATLMQTGGALLRELQRSSGRLDAGWQRLAYGYLESALLFPDPALALLIDEIRRASRDRGIAHRAAEVSRRLFD